MLKYAALTLAVAGLCLVPDGTAQSAAPQSDDVYAAVRGNDLARLKALVGSSADANAKDEQGDSPLLYSAAVGSVDAMQYLLDKGADVNVQNAFGSTALMIWLGVVIGDSDCRVHHRGHRAHRDRNCLRVLRSLRPFFFFKADTAPGRCRTTFSSVRPATHRRGSVRRIATSRDRSRRYAGSRIPT